jgi:hypothetical protein
VYSSYISKRGEGRREGVGGRGGGGREGEREAGEEGGGKSTGAHLKTLIGVQLFVQPSLIVIRQSNFRQL